MKGRSKAALGLLVALVGCSGHPEPAGDADPDGPGAPGPGSHAETPASPEAVPTAVSYDIPPGHLPPPGGCRLWMPGEPAEEQAGRYPVGRCSTLRASIEAGVWLVYRPTDDPKHVRVWQYGEDRQVLAQRIYDAATGELIRHVAPTGN